MNGGLVAVYAEIIACYANIEGMKAENAKREISGESAAYPESDFNAISIELCRLAKAALSLDGK